MWFCLVVICSLLPVLIGVALCFFFFFKQKTAYEMRISDWSPDVCSSDLVAYYAVAEAVRSRLFVLANVEDGGGVETRQLLQDALVSCVPDKIGRASCRERVCQYV